jgi:hypothetical protein
LFILIALMDNEVLFSISVLNIDKTCRVSMNTDKYDLSMLYYNHR